MTVMSVDIETFSSVDLKTCGVYPYVQSPDFQIMLFAYAINDAPVQVIDLMQGPLPGDVIEALRDPRITKRAYNAIFEWYCLNKFVHTSLDQWQCTMLQGLYCGYPGNLASLGAALGLQTQKMSAGMSLIRTFCIPCKATKSNGGRTRTLPHHEPEKWQLFKQYNAVDVETEREAARRLQNFPVPAEIQQQWLTDVVINSRGITVDTALMQAAIECDATVRDALIREAVAITGLNNPNSVSQLKGWLESELDEEISSLDKDRVNKILAEGDASPAGKRVLEIRQELGKTSVKKYQAMQKALCFDGRVRGLTQFYGANRTGRWAGRLVQVQNLPRTYVEPLDYARELTKQRKIDALRVIWGPVPSTLSQLVRTAFVAAPGCMLVDADFSAIEARVIAWLAGEQWRLDVFRTHGKIYEASASQMFGVPLERIAKGNPEYELRQKGKVAELALGYQGGAGALVSMGALTMGLIEEELPDIVERWRAANPAIVQLWYDIGNAALSVVQNCAPVESHGIIFARESDPGNDLDFLTVQLPSGRKLYYAKPYVGRNRFGGPSVHYMGMNQATKKWEDDETYGGKLVENCVQAIARDCLAEALTRLARAGYNTLMHVHDEVVIEAPEGEAEAALAHVCEIMSQPMPWAPDLPLGADGWIGGYYRKD